MSLRKLVSIVFVLGVFQITAGAAQTLLSSTVRSAVSTLVTPAPTHPPLPSANTPPLPSQFSDIPQSAISCWDAHANYSTISRFLTRELLSSESYSWEDWSTTEYSLSPYLNWECKTTPLPSVSTLCDGYPRAKTFTTLCLTSTATYTWTKTGTAHYYTPEWLSTAFEQIPSPTCTAASDFSPQCTRLNEAFKWRQQYLQSQTPAPGGSIAGPGCSVLNKADGSAQPTCYLEGGSWEAFYWPTPMPSGSDFCANVTATPTTPVEPRTTVVSGLTMTSPSVYYFLRNATLQTFAGKASPVGESTPILDKFLPSTTPSLLAVSQRESDILTIFRICAGSNIRRYCTFHASPGFAVADLSTVRADPYCGEYGCGPDRTIYQDEYKPTLGLAMSDVVTQNQLFTNCVWTTPGQRIRTAGPPAYNGGTMRSQDWHKITATSSNVSKGQITAVP